MKWHNTALVSLVLSAENGCIGSDLNTNSTLKAVESHTTTVGRNVEEAVRREIFEEVSRVTGFTQDEQRCRNSLIKKGNNIAERQSTEIGNFEGLADLNLPGNQIELRKALVTFLKQGFPNGWAGKQQVNKYVFNPRRVNLDDCTPSGPPALAYFDQGQDGTAGHIQIVDEELKKDPIAAFDYLLKELIIHELAHANDWKQSLKLNDLQSLQLRLIISRLSSNEGRPLFEYIESINVCKNRDELKNRRLRAKEYFADLMVAAFEHTYNQEMDWDKWRLSFEIELISTYKASPEQAFQNARLVYEYLMKIDPKFNIIEARKIRTDLRNKILEILNATK